MRACVSNILSRSRANLHTAKTWKPRAPWVHFPAVISMSRFILHIAGGSEEPVASLSTVLAFSPSQRATAPQKAPGGHACSVCAPASSWDNPSSFPLICLFLVHTCIWVDNSMNGPFICLEGYPHPSRVRVGLHHAMLAGWLATQPNAPFVR